MPARRRPRQPAEAPDPLARFKIAADLLGRRLDPGSLGFQTTLDVEPLVNSLGQPRAIEALNFGLANRGRGFHLFVTGPADTDREAVVLAHVTEVARERPPGSDWVYAHDFDYPDRPRAIRLQAGQGRRLAADMDGFIRSAIQRIARAFEDEAYDRRRREHLAEVAAQRQAALDELGAFAREHSFAVETTPSGIITVPLVLGSPITPQQAEALPDQQRQEIEERGRAVNEQVMLTIRKLHQLDHEAADRVRSLDREVALFTVQPLFDELREKYADQPEILQHLEEVREDLPSHLADFRQDAPEGPGPPEATLGGDRLDRYRVNVVVDHGDGKGAPVVFERNPTYYNLVGRVEYRAQLGTMVTDFRQIKAGALQRADGGFLLLDAAAVLTNPFAWEALKRALKAGEVKIENLGEQLSAVPTASLAPRPIPISTKVVMFGPAAAFRFLFNADEEFRELFKVRVEFGPDMEWNDDNVRGLAAFISRTVGERGGAHLDRDAVARTVEEAARMCGRRDRLTTRLREVADLVDEAGVWARQAGRDVVGAADVEQAAGARRRRSGLLEERIQQAIGEGWITIGTEGERVGQVNGLSVIDVGDHAFGFPSRVTARVSPGRGSVESIEREIHMSGPSHSKGVLILSGYLAEAYSGDGPLPMRATLTFEQSYEGVDGDSASSTELYALLSALSGLPARQAVAVTGSIDQHGAVQAIGAVNEKIEGFFAVCSARGLTGGEGVVIPTANLRSLMLSAEVRAAVAEGRFHVWAVSTVDEGIEILTGRPAGVRGDDGEYPGDSVHALVHERLRDFASVMREGPPQQPGEQGEEDAHTEEDEEEGRPGRPGHRQEPSEPGRPSPF